MRLVLTAAFFVLTLSAPAFADPVPVGATVLPSRPTGFGEPDAVSCYQTVPIGSHIRNLQCARNADWARARISSSGLGADIGAPSNAMGFSAVPNAGQHTPLP
jgi:hypothetical protein